MPRASRAPKMNLLGDMNVPTTVEELLEYPDRIEKLSDEQLTAILRPHFPYTRPANMPSASDARLKKMESSIPSDEEFLARARANKAKRLAAQQPTQSTNEQPSV